MCNVPNTASSAQSLMFLVWISFSKPALCCAQNWEEKEEEATTQELCFNPKTSWKCFLCQIHFLLPQISKQMVEGLVFDLLGNQQYKLVVIEFC